MSGWTYVTFESGERPIEDVEVDVLALAEEDSFVHVEEDRVVLYDSASGRGLEGVEPPCRRALAFWQHDTSMWGGGRLYERVDGRYVMVDEYSDTDGSYGRDAYNYFLVEHGIRGYRK